MTYEYKKRIDGLLLDFLSRIQLSDEQGDAIKQDLRGIIQKEFFFRLVVGLPEEDTKSIQQSIQDNGLNDAATHDTVATACLRAYSRDHMQTVLDQSMTHIVTTYINITMIALEPAQRKEVEEFQKNLLLSHAS